MPTSRRLNAQMLKCLNAKSFWNGRSRWHSNKLEKAIKLLPIRVGQTDVWNQWHFENNNKCDGMFIYSVKLQIYQKESTRITTFHLNWLDHCSSQSNNFESNLAERWRKHFWTSILIFTSLKHIVLEVQCTQKKFLWLQKNNLIRFLIDAWHLYVDSSTPSVIQKYRDGKHWDNLE